MKEYKKEELLQKAKEANGFRFFPKDYWILGVQSNQDLFNEFDDMFYLFKGEELILKTTGTTNAGTTGLLNYDRYNSKGCAVIKTKEWYYDLWKFGLHKGKMKALKQVKPIKYYRDYDKDNKAEEIGNLYEGMIGINFHTAIYGHHIGFVRKLIGGWSVGCQVANNTTDYYKIINETKNQKAVSYCLIKEF